MRRISLMLSLVLLIGAAPALAKGGGGGPKLFVGIDGGGPQATFAFILGLAGGGDGGGPKLFVGEGGGGPKLRSGEGGGGPR